MQIDDGNALIEKTINRLDYCIDTCEDIYDSYQNSTDVNAKPIIPLCELSAINSTLKLAKDIINAQNRIITERFGGL